MKTVKFFLTGRTQAANEYGSSETGDQSGDYVRAESVKSLVSAAKRALAAMKNSNCDSQAEYVLQCTLQDIETDVSIKSFEVGYRYIPPNEAFTPLMYISMQRMGLKVKAPFGREQVVDAIMEFFGNDFFPAGRDYIRDVEFYENP